MCFARCLLLLHSLKLLYILAIYCTLSHPMQLILLHLPSVGAFCVLPAALFVGDYAWVAPNNLTFHVYNISVDYIVTSNSYRIVALDTLQVSSLLLFGWVCLEFSRHSCDLGTTRQFFFKNVKSTKPKEKTTSQSHSQKNQHKNKTSALEI